MNEQDDGERRISVGLFRGSGKWYTDDLWRVPPNAMLPSDMLRSPDFRRIDNGPVLTPADEWGYEHLLMPEN